MFKTLKHLIAWMLVAMLFFTACSSGIKYAVRGDYKTDGQLMDLALKAACDELVKIDTVKSYKVKSIEDLDSDVKNALHNSASDILSSALLSREQAGSTDVAVKFRIVECQTRYYHDNGMTRRAAKASYHIRFEDAESSKLLWAGDFVGTAEDKVPNDLVKKLIDTRYEQVGQTMPTEESANPIIEPILVVGITGALIYLFSATAK